MKKTFIATALLAISLNLFAQQPEAPAAPATAPANNDAASYSARIPAEQMIELDAAGDKFRARRIPDLSGEPRGAVIVLHDSAHNPVWPHTVDALSDDLPLHGWDTLSIELPTPDATPAPADTATPTAAGTEPRAQARIAAALKYYIDAKATPIALIGFGSGAIRAAEFLRAHAAANAGNYAPIGALVMVMPLQKLNGIAGDLPKILPATAAPALDIILDGDSQTRADAEARRRAVLHQRDRLYRQLQLPPLNNASDPQHNLMVKRVRAWLQQNASANNETNAAQEKQTAAPAKP